MGNTKQNTKHKTCRDLQHNLQNTTLRHNSIYFHIKVLFKRKYNTKYKTKTEYNMPPLERPCQREIQHKIQNKTQRQDTICFPYKGPVKEKYNTKYKIQNKNKIQYVPLRKARSTRNTTQFTKYNSKTGYNMLPIKGSCQRKRQHKIQNTTPKQNTICPP